MGESVEVKPAIFRWLAHSFFKAMLLDSLTLVVLFVYMTSLLRDMPVFGFVWSTVIDRIGMANSSSIYCLVLIFGLGMSQMGLYGGYDAANLTLAGALINLLQQGNH